MLPLAGRFCRTGSHKAPRYVSWSAENRSQLIRIPAAIGEYRRAELRSPDPCANPYLAFALMIYAALEGIQGRFVLGDPCDFNLYTADAETLSHLEKLPGSWKEACNVARTSAFIRKYIPEEILSLYCGH